MVEKIYDIKNKVLQYAERVTQDVNRMDTKEVSELADAVKDFAEAEKACWEAEYYKSIVGSMSQGQGYGGGTGSSAGYGGQGYQRQQGYSRQGYQGGSMGHHDVTEPLRMAIQSASPDERDRLRNEVKTIIGAM